MIDLTGTSDMLHCHLFVLPIQLVHILSYATSKWLNFFTQLLPWTPFSVVSLQNWEEGMRKGFQWVGREICHLFPCFESSGILYPLKLARDCTWLVTEHCMMAIDVPKEVSEHFHKVVSWRFCFSQEIESCFTSKRSIRSLKSSPFWFQGGSFFSRKLMNFPSLTEHHQFKSIHSIGWCPSRAADHSRPCLLPTNKRTSQIC